MELPSGRTEGDGDLSRSASPSILDAPYMPLAGTLRARGVHSDDEGVSKIGAATSTTAEPKGLSSVSSSENLVSLDAQSEEQPSEDRSGDQSVELSLSATRTDSAEAWKSIHYNVDTSSSGGTSASESDSFVKERTIAALSNALSLEGNEDGLSQRGLDDYDVDVEVESALEAHLRAASPRRQRRGRSGSLGEEDVEKVSRSRRPHDARKHSPSPSLSSSSSATNLPSTRAGDQDTTNGKRSRSPARSPLLSPTHIHANLSSSARIAPVAFAKQKRSTSKSVIYGRVEQDEDGTAYDNRASQLSPKRTYSTSGTRNPCALLERSSTLPGNVVISSRGKRDRPSASGSPGSWVFGVARVPGSGTTESSTDTAATTSWGDRSPELEGTAGTTSGEVDFYDLPSSSSSSRGRGGRGGTIVGSDRARYLKKSRGTSSTDAHHSGSHSSGSSSHSTGYVSSSPSPPSSLHTSQQWSERGSLHRKDRRRKSRMSIKLPGSSSSRSVSGSGSSGDSSPDATPTSLLMEGEVNLSLSSKSEMPVMLKGKKEKEKNKKSNRMFKTKPKNTVLQDGAAVEESEMTMMVAERDSSKEESRLKRMKKKSSMIVRGRKDKGQPSLNELGAVRSRDYFSNVPEAGKRDCRERGKEDPGTSRGGSALSAPSSPKNSVPLTGGRMSFDGNSATPNSATSSVHSTGSSSAIAMPCLVSPPTRLKHIMRNQTTLGTRSGGGVGSSITCSSGMGRMSERDIASPRSRIGTGSPRSAKRNSMMVSSMGHSTGLLTGSHSNISPQKQRKPSWGNRILDRKSPTLFMGGGGKGEGRGGDGVGEGEEELGVGKSFEYEAELREPRDITVYVDVFEAWRLLFIYTPSFLYIYLFPLSLNSL